MTRWKSGTSYRNQYQNTCETWTCGVDGVETGDELGPTSTSSLDTTTTTTTTTTMTSTNSNHSPVNSPDSMRVVRK